MRAGEVNVRTCQGIEATQRSHTHQQGDKSRVELAVGHGGMEGAEGFGAAEAWGLTSGKFIDSL